MPIPPPGKALAGPGSGFIVAGLAIIIFYIAVAVAAPYIAPYSPYSKVGDVAEHPSPPSLKHPFGTNEIGYDMFSRVVLGTRIVLKVVLLSSVMGLIIGVPLGLVSGYFGGPLDRVLSIIMDSLYAFPGIVLAIAIASVLGPSVINAAIALMVVYVPAYFRMTRARVIETKTQDYIVALRVLGAPHSRIMSRHILPGVMPTVLVVYGLASADAILTEAGLSFFGLVVTYPAPDWGLDISYGIKQFLSGSWWLTLFPGLAILTLALGFAMVGEGLAERFRARAV
ncbi:ABC transporter permease [Aeropyrum camini]|uniref:ABC transporter permease n=1 Tax=Aeropyrum camini TaxID=229980 RepID=UPI001E5BC120|nr:ABC transporter permease [Aeropyrum camini]